MDVIKGAVKFRMSHICTQIWEKIIDIQSVVNPFDQVPCRKSMSEIISALTLKKSLQKIIKKTSHFMVKCEIIKSATNLFFRTAIKEGSFYQ